MHPLEVKFEDNNLRLQAELQIGGKGAAVGFAADGQSFQAKMHSLRQPEVACSFGESVRMVEAGFGTIQKVTVYENAEPYAGPYEATPKVDAQTLPTAQKFMAQDVTVNAIPVFDVTNNSGGTTVYIAKEVI